MKIQNALVSDILDRSQRYFAHVTKVTLLWRVQNIVVIGRVYFTLECFEFSSNFEFDRNMLSRTGARCFVDNRPEVGVTKSISPVPLFSEFFWIYKTHASYWLSRLYLTGVTAVQLRQHMWNMNVIQKNLTGTFAKSKFLLTKKLTNAALVTPTPALLRQCEYTASTEWAIEERIKNK